ncbi:hypothetical protein BC829DRAFT_406113 [Chytridium lagenaria]|nr:hypothetical protein BC829DRAFT_406113 [Chytridium lagenaria]
MTSQTQDELRTFFYTKTTDMRKSWYPILKPSGSSLERSFGMHILDDPIVVYRDDETKQVVAFMDKCPHRSAPLSRYHGWQFNAEGAVTHIPSLPSTKSIPANAKVYKYPIHEDEFFVWIWPGKLEDCEKVEKPELRFFEKHPMKPRTGYNDFDIDHCLFVENFLDPAHLPFTHDTTISSRSEATPMTMDCIFTPSGTIHGTSSTPDRPTTTPIRFEFIPPCTVNLSFKNSSEQTFYCVPTQKGHVRFFWIQRFTFLAWYLDYYFPKYNSKVTQEDYAMLVGQQKNLAHGANAMNSPVAADIMIKTYRNWWRRAIKKNPYFQGYSTDIEDIVLNGCASRCGGEVKGEAEGEDS